MIIIFWLCKSFCAGNCASCLSVTRCDLSTEIRLSTMIWVSESLIQSPCELHINGELLRNVELDQCIQLLQEEIDFEMDNLTFVCSVCHDLYRIQYDIPKTSLINAVNCRMNGIFIV